MFKKNKLPIYIFINIVLFSAILVSSGIINISDITKRVISPFSKESTASDLKYSQTSTRLEPLVEEIEELLGEISGSGDNEGLLKEIITLAETASCDHIQAICRETDWFNVNLGIGEVAVKGCGPLMSEDSNGPPEIDIWSGSLISEATTGNFIGSLWNPAETDFLSKQESMTRKMERFSFLQNIIKKEMTTGISEELYSMRREGREDEADSLEYELGMLLFLMNPSDPDLESILDEEVINDGMDLLSEIGVTPEEASIMNIMEGSVDLSPFVSACAAYCKGEIYAEMCTSIGTVQEDITLKFGLSFGIQDIEITDLIVSNIGISLPEHIIIRDVPSMSFDIPLPDIRVEFPQVPLAEGSIPDLGLEVNIPSIEIPSPKIANPLPQPIELSCPVYEGQFAGKYEKYNIEERIETVEVDWYMQTFDYLSRSCREIPYEVVVERTCEDIIDSGGVENLILLCEQKYNSGEIEGNSEMISMCSAAFDLGGSPSLPEIKGVFNICSLPENENVPVCLEVRRALNNGDEKQACIVGLRDAAKSGDLDSERDSVKDAFEDVPEEEYERYAQEGSFLNPETMRVECFNPDLIIPTITNDCNYIWENYNENWLYLQFFREAAVEETVFQNDYTNWKQFFEYLEDYSTEEYEETFFEVVEEYKSGEHWDDSAFDDWADAFYTQYIPLVIFGEGESALSFEERLSEISYSHSEESSEIENFIRDDLIKFYYFINEEVGLSSVGKTEWDILFDFVDDKNMWAGFFTFLGNNNTELGHYEFYRFLKNYIPGFTNFFDIIPTILDILRGVSHDNTDIFTQYSENNPYPKQIIIPPKICQQIGAPTSADITKNQQWQYHLSYKQYIVDFYKQFVRLMRSGGYRLHHSGSDPYKDLREIVNGHDFIAFINSYGLYKLLSENNLIGPDFNDLPSSASYISNSYEKCRFNGGTDEQCDKYHFPYTNFMKEQEFFLDLFDSENSDISHYDQARFLYFVKNYDYFPGYSDYLNLWKDYLQWLDSLDLLEDYSNYADIWGEYIYLLENLDLVKDYSDYNDNWTIYREFLENNDLIENYEEYIEKEDEDEDEKEYPYNLLQFLQDEDYYEAFLSFIEERPVLLNSIFEFLDNRGKLSNFYQLLSENNHLLYDIFDFIRDEKNMSLQLLNFIDSKDDNHFYRYLEFLGRNNISVYPEIYSDEIEGDSDAWEAFQVYLDNLADSKIYIPSLKDFLHNEEVPFLPVPESVCSLVEIPPADKLCSHISDFVDKHKCESFVAGMSVPSCTEMWKKQKEYILDMDSFLALHWSLNTVSDSLSEFGFLSAWDGFFEYLSIKDMWQEFFLDEGGTSGWYMFSTGQNKAVNFLEERRLLENFISYMENRGSSSLSSYSAPPQLRPFSNKTHLFETNFNGSMLLFNQFSNFIKNNRSQAFDILREIQGNYSDSVYDFFYSQIAFELLNLYRPMGGTESRWWNPFSSGDDPVDGENIQLKNQITKEDWIGWSRILKLNITREHEEMATIVGKLIPTFSENSAIRRACVDLHLEMGLSTSVCTSDPLLALKNRCNTILEREKEKDLDRRVNIPESCAVLPIFDEDVADIAISYDFEIGGGDDITLENLIVKGYPQNMIGCEYSSGADLSMPTIPQIPLSDFSISIPDIITPDFKLWPLFDVVLPNIYIEDLTFPDLDICNLNDCQEFIDIFPSLMNSISDLGRIFYPPLPNMPVIPIELDSLKLEIEGIEGVFYVPMPEILIDDIRPPSFSFYLPQLPELSPFSIAVPEYEIPEIRIPEPSVKFTFEGFDVNIASIVGGLMMGALGIDFNLSGCVSLSLPQFIPLVIHFDHYYFTWPDFPEIPEIEACNNMRKFCGDSKQKLEGLVERANDVVENIEETVQNTLALPNDAAKKVQDLINDKVEIAAYEINEFLRVHPLQGRIVHGALVIDPIEIPLSDIEIDVDISLNDIIGDVPMLIEIPWGELQDALTIDDIRIEMPDIPLSELSIDKEIEIELPGLQGLAFDLDVKTSANCVAEPIENFNPFQEELPKMETNLDFFREQKTEINELIRKITPKIR